MAIQKITIDKTGFLIDEEGNYVHLIDNNGNCIIQLVNHEDIIFNPTDKLQVRKVISQLAEIMFSEFAINLEREYLFFYNDENIYTVEPGHLRTIEFYFKNINNTLNYYGSVYDFLFEYRLFLKFKEIANNTLISSKTKLYNGLAIKECVEFATEWFFEKDNIYCQKLELFKVSETQIKNQTDNSLNVEDNPNPRIFINSKSFELFKYLHENLVRNRYLLADYSFIFRYMQKDGYIDKHTPESEFRDFLSKDYKIVIDKLKLKGYCETESKMNLYSTAINLFKSK